MSALAPLHLASGSRALQAVSFSLLSSATAATDSDVASGSSAATTAAVAQGSQFVTSGAHSRLRASAMLHLCAAAMRRRRWCNGRINSDCGASCMDGVRPGGRKRQPTAMPNCVGSGTGVGAPNASVTNVPRAANRRRHRARQGPLAFAGTWSLVSREIAPAFSCQVLSSAAMLAHAFVMQKRLVAVRKSHCAMRHWPSSIGG
mmetsp:Transcript_33337/g.87753  ORF Transcript_33337/g.87753 Transcript_33337/m.87753 type:complete len:203 (-) Transcript_33337:100-708(-)